MRNGKWQIEIEVMARKASQWLGWKKALKSRENQTEIEKVKIKTLVNKWDKLQSLKKSITTRRRIGQSVLKKQIE